MKLANYAKYSAITIIIASFWKTTIQVMHLTQGAGKMVRTLKLPEVGTYIPESAIAINFDPYGIHKYLLTVAGDATAKS